METRKKLSDLTEPAVRPLMVRDNAGNFYWEQETYLTQRPIKTIEPGRRLAHYLIDSFCFGICIFVVQFLVLMVTYVSADRMSTTTGHTIMLIEGIVELLLYPLFYIICEYKWQKTPGKFITGTIVIDEYAGRPELRAIIVRTISRIVPFEPFSCLGAPFSRGWHDRWSNTYVVSKEEAVALRKELEE